MLPSPPQEINTKFYFYSTKNRSDRPLMELPFLNMTQAFQKSGSYHANKRSTNEALFNITTDSPYTSSTTTTASSTTSTPKTYYRKSQPITLNDLEGFDEMSVRVIVHGFGSACPHVWIYEMKTALMAVVGFMLKK